MLQTNTGVTGAKRQSWRRANPRDVLKSIIDKNPDMTEDEVELECWDIIHTDENQMRSVYEYWFANNFRSLAHPQPHVTPRSPRQRAEAKSALRAGMDDSIKAEVEEKVQIALLDMLLPNGKQLRSSTREELLECGGWMGRVAEKLKPKQTVAQARISERQLRQLYAA